MEFATYGIVESGEVVHPRRYFVQTQPCVAPPLLVPIDSGYRIFRRKMARGFAGVVVNCTQASHARVGDIRTIVTCNPVVEGCHNPWILSKIEER